MIVFVSQVYVPDPASLGQHMADLAEATAQQDKTVLVITSRNGYENPKIHYPLKENIRGVSIIRLPLCSFGKSSLFLRVLGGVLFIAQTVCCILKQKKVEKIVVSTSPPFAGAIGWFFKKIKNIPFTYWVMDVNPDQAVNSGSVKKNSWPVRWFDVLQHHILKEAQDVVVLDHYMQKKIHPKNPSIKQFHTIPPWPHCVPTKPIHKNDSVLRKKLQLPEPTKVFMFSGNLSLFSPINTLLEAGLQPPSHNNVHFIISGGGNGRKNLPQDIHHRSDLFTLLPYQPLELLQDTLACADIHIVSLGDNMVGINHPCKIYGAMAVGKPIVYIGPEESHIGDILKKHHIGWIIPHGNHSKALSVLREIENTPHQILEDMGKKAHLIVRDIYHKDILLNKMTSVVCGY